MMSSMLNPALVLERAIRNPRRLRSAGDLATLARASVLTLAIGSLGCSTTTLLDFTVVSTRSVELVENDNLQRGDQRVRAEMLQRIFLFLPVGELDVQQTIGNAISSEPGCVALLDGSIKRHDRIFFPFLYADIRLTVEGTPLIDRARLPPP